MTFNGKVNGRKIKPAVTVIIQARMQSKRLPGKAMLDLAGKPVIAHVIERAKSIEHVDKVVLATGSAHENQQILDLASSMDIEAFSGSESNVLERYYMASEKYGGEYIVRITGDNPFTDVEYASMIVDIALESKFDLCALANMPLGTAVEVIKKDAQKAKKAANALWSVPRLWTQPADKTAGLHRGTPQRCPRCGGTLEQRSGICLPPPG